VAGHYDALDEAYRRVWGDHVHHGLWVSGDESPQEAAVALARHVADVAAVARGAEVVDVGCGYGATARLLARERGAAVTGLTLSRAQVSAAPAADNVSLLVRDWLANGLFSGRYDAAIAIESLSHMPDKPRAFAELGRVVKPGGRVVVVDWLTSERPSRLERGLLLRPICEEGHLPSMHSAPEYAALLREAGFAVDRVEDLTARAARTWAVVVRRLVPLLVRDGGLRRRLLRSSEVRFALSLGRIPLAYRLGSMRLGLLAGTRVAGSGSP
jgi:tocopherol O-methyltransferase